MKAPTLNYEQLQKAKLTYNELSYQGFLLNVARSFNEGLIDEIQREELLDNANPQT